MRRRRSPATYQHDCRHVSATDQKETPVRDFDKLPVLITIPVAAQLLGISRASAYRWAETGVLPVKRLGGRIYILRDRLREMMEAA